MNHLFIRILVAMTTLALPFTALANEIIFQAGEEWIARDVQTGEYIIHYLGDDETSKTVRWTPATEIDVSITSRFKVDNGKIRYGYKIKNHKTSKQPVIRFKVLARSASDDHLVTPLGWFGRVIENYNDPNGLVTLSWLGKSPQQIAVGDSKAGFAIIHSDLPAVGVASIGGQMSLLSFPDEGPSGPLMDFMEQSGFMRQAMNGVFRHTAVPRIPVSTPFDAAKVLIDIRTHLNQDLVPMNLVEAVFAAELTRLLTAAIEAAKYQNDKGLRQNLKDIRKALKKAHRDMDTDDEDDRARKHRHGNKDDRDDWEHTDPKQKPKPAFIDKLAARVLDFDVKYVLGRLGKD